MLREPDDMYGPEDDEEDEYDCRMQETGYIKKSETHTFDYIGEELNRILMAVYRTGNVEEIVDALDNLSGMYKFLNIADQETAIVRKPMQIKTKCDYLNFIASITKTHANV